VAGGRWCPRASPSPSRTATRDSCSAQRLALRHGVTCLNAPGLIDSGYRGELRVVLVNTDPHADYQVHRGDRIAQLVVMPAEQATFLRWSSSRRRPWRGGFGHTGR